MLDGIQRRAFLFLIKRYLGDLLKSEPDLGQVGLRLGAGDLELREVLLDCDYLNTHLGSTGVEVTAGYVSRIEAQIDWSTLAVRIGLEEVLLTVQPSSNAVHRQAPVKEHQPVEEAEDNVFFGQQVFADILTTIQSKIKVTIAGWTIRLEDNCESQNVVVVHGDRISCGAFNEELDSDDIDDHMYDREDPSFSVIVEGVSVEVDNSCEPGDNTDPVQLASLDGGQLHLTSSHTQKGVDRQLKITLGPVGISIESSSIESLGEGVHIVQKIIKQALVNLGGSKHKYGEFEKSRGAFADWGTDAEEDEDEFHDCLSRPGSLASSYHDLEETTSSKPVELPAAEQSSLQIYCEVPVVSLSLEYASDSGGKSRKESGGLDLFLEGINATGTYQKGKDAAWRLSMSSIVCFECAPVCEPRLSPKDAQTHVAGIKALPRVLREFIEQGAQTAVSAEKKALVFPLFQIGFQDAALSGKPCLEIFTGSIHKAQKTNKIEIRSQQLAVWASCSSLRRILMSVNKLKDALDAGQGVQHKTSSAFTVNNHVQRVINDIDSRMSGKVSKQAEDNLEIAWHLPGILYVLEKLGDSGGCSGLIFTHWKCESGSHHGNERGTHLFKFEKGHAWRSVRGGKSAREAVQSMHIQAAELWIYNVCWDRGPGKGECKRIAKVEKEKAPCSVDSNLMLDLDATDNMSAVSIDVTVKPDAVGHMMASVADSFVDWHSVDRWAEGDGCWHEEGSYKEVEFQAKCVDMAKVFVRVYVSTVQAVLSQNDMKDIMRTVGNLLPADKKEKRAVQIHDQVTILITGSVNCTLRPTSSVDETLEATTSNPMNPYKLVIQDLGILKTTGLSGKPISALWAWCRGLKLLGGKQDACYVYAPAPVDSQLPNPPGVELARLEKPEGVHGDSLGERISFRLKGVTITTDTDDLDFSVLRGLARYAPRGNESKSSRKKELVFAVNVENIGLRCEPGKDWETTTECPTVAGVVYVEGMHCVGSSCALLHQAVAHSLSVHLANSEARDAGVKGIESPVDLQAIQLQKEGFHCIAQEGALRLGVSIVHKEDDAKPGPSNVAVEVGNHKLIGNLSHESLRLAVLFIRQVQGILPPPMETDSDGGLQDGAANGEGLLGALQEDTFRQAPVVNSMMASECIAGKWCEEEDDLTDIMDDWISDIAYFTPCEPEPAETAKDPDSQQGVWFDGEPPKLVDEYVQVPQLSESQTASGVEWSSCLRLSEEHPEPLFTLFVKDISALVVLQDDLTRKEGRLELDICSLNLKLDNFDKDMPFIRRIAIQVQAIEFRDCRSSASDDIGWQFILSRYWQRSQKSGKQRLPNLTSPMIEISMESAPTKKEGCQDELRIKVGIVPLRLRLDQAVIDVLVAYIKCLPPGPVSEAEINQDAVPFFQICEVTPLCVVVDYLPRKLDIHALSTGSVAEVLNFVRWGGVKLNLKGMKVAGVLGWDNMIKALCGEWQKEIVGNQVHKFVKGIPPVRSILRISSAARTVFSDSVDSLMGTTRLGKQHSRSSASHQLRRSTVSLLRVIALEALNAGASVTAGAQMVLQGSVDPIPPKAPGSHSGTIVPGLRQTRACVESAFKKVLNEPMESFKNGEGMGSVFVKTIRAAPAAVVAPATAAASALRYTIVECRNSLDVDGAFSE